MEPDDDDAFLDMAGGSNTTLSLTLTLRVILVSAYAYAEGLLG